MRYNLWLSGLYLPKGTTMNECVQEPAVITETQIQQLFAKAHAAQAAFEAFSQEQVDAIVKGIGSTHTTTPIIARMRRNRHRR
jgi:hypothetical protein